MAQLSLGEAKWRMVRRVLKRGRFGYPDARNMNRQDGEHFGWLIANGFFVRVGDDQYEVTDRGKAAAELGLYEL